MPAGAKFCFECATPVSAPGFPPRLASPEAYTPQHLAERIIRLEGRERKQVTVLFADSKSSTELLADRDPEEARKILDPVIERMGEAGVGKSRLVYELTHSHRVQGWATLEGASVSLAITSSASLGTTASVSPSEGQSSAPGWKQGRPAASDRRPCGDRGVREERGRAWAGHRAGRCEARSMVLSRTARGLCGRADVAVT